MAVASDVLVVGGGLAGRVAALAAAAAGADVRLLSHTQSTLRQASGLVDVLGYADGGGEAGAGGDGARPPLADPFAGADALPEEHPYRVLGDDAVRAGLALFDRAVGEAYAGGHTERNALVPTPAGRVKPTARYPRSVAPGLASAGGDALLVGFPAVTALDAPLAAEGLDGRVPFAVRGVTVDFPGDLPADAARTRYARRLDADEPAGETGDGARTELAARVRPHLGDADRVGFPALLGTDHTDAVRASLADALGVPVFEVPTGPPSVPGTRLAARLDDALADAGVTVTTGNPVVDCESAGGRLERVVADREGARVEYRAEAFVLATGGLVGRGVESDREGVREPVFGCHVSHPPDRYDWSADDPWGEHAFPRFGVRIDARARPLDAGGDPEFANLFAAGAVVGGYDAARELSASGVSLATGHAAGTAAAREADA